MLNKKYQVTITLNSGSARRRVVMAGSPGEAKRKVLLKSNLAEDQIKDISAEEVIYNQ